MAQISVRKRNNKWEYRFEAARIDGKRKQITKGGFKTKSKRLKQVLQQKLNMIMLELALLHLHYHSMII